MVGVKVVEEVAEEAAAAAAEVGVVEREQE